MKWFFRDTPLAPRGKVVGVAIAAIWSFSSPPATAQDMVFRFNDPSFGGNPFNSTHLLAIAAIDRPAAPTVPTTPLTQEELLAQQLQAQLLSGLSGNILDSINNAKVGDSGNFTFGNQQVSFTKTADGTSVIFTNTATGVTKTIVIPPAGKSASSSASTGGNPAATASESASNSAELALGSPGNINIASRQPNLSILGSAEQTLLASSRLPAGSGSVLPPF